jgi:tRNA (cytidine/uridine-2'-O-)-methyltransferase
MLGRESSGVPELVHDAADARIVIPMSPKLRSINVAMAAAMVLGDALKRTGHFSRMKNKADGS